MTISTHPCETTTYASHSLCRKQTAVFRRRFPPQTREPRLLVHFFELASQLINSSAYMSPLAFREVHFIASLTDFKPGTFSSLCPASRANQRHGANTIESLARFAHMPLASRGSPLTSLGDARLLLLHAG